jgi:LemA protein
MTWIIIGVVAFILLALVYIYNSLVRAKVRTDEAWSDITVQMKRRLDLIPNLVESVRGYAKHEKEVFENVTKARTSILNSKTVAETAKSENMLEGALKSLFAVSENYPQLRATENFQQLQSELVDTEDKIQAARRYYNGAARDLNIKIQSFPTNLIAGILGFKIREFFDVDANQEAAVKEPVQVDFSDKK